MAESNVKLIVDATQAVGPLKQTTAATQKLEQSVKKTNGQLRATTGELGRTGKAAATATGNIQRFGVAFRTTLAPIVAATGAVTFLSRSLNVLGQREADTAALLNGLRKLGEGEEALRRLQQSADALGKATLFDQEDFDRGFALLTSFQRIGVDSYERVAKAAADVAQITGQDVKSALLQLSKALEDPARRVTDLSRSGTVFTEQQKEQIKALQESGRLIEAQNLVLREIEKQYGGAAEAAGSAGYAGAVDSLGESFRDLQERLAVGVQPAVVGTLTVMTDLFDLVSKIPAPVGKAALGIGATATAIIALKAAATAAIPVVKALFALVLANPFVALAAGITAATVALAGYRNEAEKIADAAAGGGAAEIQAARAKLIETEQEISLKKLELQDANGKEAQQIKRELARLRSDAEELRKSIPAIQPEAAALATPLAENNIVSTSAKDAKAAGKTELERQQEAANKLKESLQNQRLLATALTKDEREMLQLKIDKANIDKRFPLLAEEARDKLKEQLEILYAQKEVTEAKLETADKEAKAIADAAEAAKKEGEQLKQLYASIGATIQAGIVDTITSAIDGSKSLKESFSGLLKQLGGIFLQAGIGGIGSSLGIPGFAANGGPVRGGNPYVVGERGPELFVPGQDGGVMRNEDMRRLMGRSPAGSGNAGTSMNFTFETTSIGGTEYVSREQLEKAMATTRRQAASDGAKRGMNMTLDRMQNSPRTRSRVGIS